ncbi:MAG: hypothetical protein WC748_02625 [Legionellales bacterium]|jgi:hypothetical protein
MIMKKLLFIVLSSLGIIACTNHALHQQEVNDTNAITEKERQQLEMDRLESLGNPQEK